MEASELLDVSRVKYWKYENQWRERYKRAGCPYRYVSLFLLLYIYS